MTMHSLTKSAIFFGVGHIAQAKGTQRIADIRGLTESHPLLGWGLVLGVVAIAGMPPLGIFMSEFLVVSSTFAREPLLALPLVAGLLIGFGALMLRMQGLAFGAPGRQRAPVKASYAADVRPSRRSCCWPASICRRRWSPGSRTSPCGWARTDGGRRAPCRPARRRRSGRRRTGRGRASGSSDAGLARRGRAAGRRARSRCSACSASRTPCTWRCSTRPAATLAVVSLACPSGRFPSVGAAARAGDPARADDLRPVRPGGRGRARRAALARPRRLGRPTARSARSPRRPRRPTPYPFLPAEGESLHQIPVGPVHAGIIEPGHFRFTAERRDRGPPGGAPRLRPQGHRGADGRAPISARAAQARRPHLGRQHGRLCARVRPRRGSRARRSRRRRARSGCAR